LVYVVAASSGRPYFSLTDPNNYFTTADVVEALDGINSTKHPKNVRCHKVNLKASFQLMREKKPF